MFYRLIGISVRGIILTFLLMTTDLFSGNAKIARYAEREERTDDYRWRE